MYFDRITVFEVLRYKHFEHDNAVEINNRIMFDFYPGLPDVLFNHTQFVCMWCMYTYVRCMMYDTYIYIFYIREIKGHAAGWQMAEL